MEITFFLLALSASSIKWGLKICQFRGLFWLKNVAEKYLVQCLGQGKYSGNGNFSNCDKYAMASALKDNRFKEGRLYIYQMTVINNWRRHCESQEW